VPPSADFIITHARALTQNPAQPRAEAVAVRGNRLVFVGDTAEAARFRGPGTRVIDGQQCTLLPGFIDAHFHLLWGSLWLGAAQLYEATSGAAALAILRDFAHQHPDQPWVEGRGLRYDLISGRRELDTVAPDRPVYVVAYDGHTA